MSLGARLLMFWIGSAAVIAGALFIWGWRSGQFRDIEEAKYRMLDDREPEPWPDREDSGKEDDDEGVTGETQGAGRGGAESGLNMSDRLAAAGGRRKGRAR